MSKAILENLFEKKALLELESFKQDYPDEKEITVKSDDDEEPDENDDEEPDELKNEETLKTYNNFIHKYETIYQLYCVIVGVEHYHFDKYKHKTQFYEKFNSWRLMFHKLRMEAKIHWNKKLITMRILANEFGVLSMHERKCYIHYSQKKK